jgi:hypothetical protein
MVVAIGELEGASHLQTRHKHLASLQAHLLKTRDPVDELIARFAENLGLGSGVSSLSVCCRTDG